MEKKCLNCGGKMPKRNNQYCSITCSNTHKQLSKDPNFLEHSEEVKNYMIGLIWTDGCLSQQEGKSERITISTTDMDIVEQLHPIMCPDRKIYISKPRSSSHQEGYALVNMNRDAIEYLKEQGLEQRKSHTLAYPKIDNENFGHFLRGVFDGDGSVYRNGNYKVVSVTGASDNFLNGLQEQLRSFGINSAIVDDSRGQAKYLRVYRKGDIAKLSYIMYDNATIYIGRKKAVFYDDIV
jgi:DNA-binding transcriptional regulator WhiA